MHRKYFFVAVAAWLLYVPTAATAQIGWTPNQLETKYGKAIHQIPVSPRLIVAFYPISPKKFPLLAGADKVKEIRVTLLDGRVRKVALNGSGSVYLCEDRENIGLAVIDEHPDKNSIRNRINPTNSYSGVYTFDYKEYRVSARVDGAYIFIDPLEGTRLAKDIDNENNSGAAASVKRDSDRITKEIR